MAPPEGKGPKEKVRAVDDQFVLLEDILEPQFLDVLANDQGKNKKDNLSVQTIEPTSLSGIVEIAADGSGVLYSPGGAFESLAQGETAQEEFTYTYLSTAGLTSSATVTIEIQGRNDAPTAMDDFFAGSTGSVISGNLLANDSDIDNGDTLTAIAGSFTTARGANLSIGEDGTFTYDPGASSELTNLAEGAMLQDMAAYTVKDSQGAESTAIATFDMTGTGAPPSLDFVIMDMNSSGHRSIALLNDGSGNYTETAEPLTPNAGFYVRDIAVADFDGDGDQDLAMGNRGTSEILFNDGAGNFSFTGVTFHDELHQHQDVEAADIDGDGDIDLVVDADMEINKGGISGVYVFDNDGTGHFDAGTRISGYGVNDDFDLIDMNNDGYLDIIGAAALGSHRPVALNDGAGNFTVVDQLLTVDGGKTAAGDLNGDGNADAILGNRLFFGTGDGRLAQVDGHLFDDNGTSGIELADLDGDNDLDVFFARSLGGASTPNQVWFNDGAGNLSDSGQRLGTGNSADVELLDADNDGDIDALVANYGPLGSEKGTSKLWLNDGSGQFTEGAEFVYSYSSDIAAGYFDDFVPPAS